MKKLGVVFLLLMTMDPDADADARGRCRYNRMSRNFDCGPSFAFFEFAPASGTGMGSACACTTITGAKGETMTFTRASTGTCMKGGEVTGIQNGDLVTCAVDQPRVMAGGDGSGSLGLSVWQANTNNVLRSAELDNAAWSGINLGAALPTITANAGTAPDGTVSAERIQFPATTAAQYSLWRQPNVCRGGFDPFSVFVKGFSGSGSIDLCSDDGSVFYCVSTAYNATTWTRVEQVATGGSGVTGGVYIGNSGFTGVPSAIPLSARSAADVLVSGAQCEPGTGTSRPSPHIPTTGSAVTRAEEVADLALTFGAGTTGFSHAATTVTASTPPAQMPFPAAMIAIPGNLLPGNALGSPSYSFGYYQTVFRLDVTTSTPNSYVSALSSSATSNRWAEYHTGALINACLNSTCDTGAAAIWSAPTWTRHRIGSYSTGYGYINGVQKLICLDPDSLRCR